MEQSIIHKFRGSSKEIGLAIGNSIGKRFAKNIDRMTGILDENYGLNYKKINNEAMSWLENLPAEYQTELEGVSIGSGCPLEKIARWYYSGMCIDGSCTSFIIRKDNFCWIGRNNDYLLPKYWGHVNIIEVDDKIPVMLFGLEGDIFSGTGFNKEMIWIHYNWLPLWETVSSLNKEVLAPFVFIRKALESCCSINDVEILLKRTIRDGGMNLFVVDGKNNEFAVYESTSKKYKKRQEQDTFIAGANHYCAIEVPDNYNFDFKNSIKRQTRVEELLALRKDLSTENMIDILADPQVEQSDQFSGTVYSNLACPGKDLVWFAYDDFPAASKGSWQKVDWNW